MFYLVKATVYELGSLDKNGNMPIYLQGLTQELPRFARVINGTIAENLGIEPNESYAISIVEDGEYNGNPKYRHTVLHNVDWTVLLQQLTAPAVTSTPTPTPVINNES